MQTGGWRQVCYVPFGWHGLRDGSMQGERDSCGTSGTVYGVRIFPGNGSKDGKFCSGAQRRGGDVFYSGYLRSGPVYRNL